MDYNNIYLFLTDGFEETEALTTVDVLRRASIPVKTVSITGKESVISKGQIQVQADMLFDMDTLQNADALILPGGAVLDGYRTHLPLSELLKNHAENKKLIAAICAAPVFLSDIGLLQGHTAVCYPALTDELTTNGVSYGRNIVEVSGEFITSKGPATTPYFALAIVEKIKGSEKMEEIRKAFLIDLIG